MPGLCAGREMVERGLACFDFEGFLGRGEVEAGLRGLEALGSGEIWRVANRSLVGRESDLEATSSSSADIEAEFRESFRRLGPCCLVREKIVSSAAPES